MNKQLVSLLVVAAILCIGIVLRLYLLGSIPIALNRDEAALGYTAWSILNTKEDEHGVAFPINIQSFGDWKLPVYVYTLIPIVHVLGLSEFSTRLVSALSGIFIVVATYLLCRQITTDKKLAYLSAALIAVSPWAVHISRIAYEANLALALFMIGLILFFLSVKSLASRTTLMRSGLLLCCGSLFFGLTLFTYHSYQIFTPLFGIGLLILYWPEFRLYWKRMRYWTIAAVGIALLFSTALVVTQNSGANTTKYAGISIFSEQQYEQRLYEDRQATAALPSVVSKMYSSMPLLIATRAVDNVMKLVNPHFLFQVGGSNGSHNLPGIGNIYWFGLVTIPIGVFVCLRYRKRHHLLVLYWAAVAGVAPLITIDSAHSIRFSPALVPLEILSAMGILFSIQWLARRHQLAGFSAAILIACTVAYSVFLFVVTYFTLFPQTGLKNWSWYMKDIVSIATADEYDDYTVYMQGEGSSPYIWFLFYHPKKYSHSELEYYPTSQGFVHGKRASNIVFGDINWSQVATSSGAALLFVRPSELKDGQTVPENIVRTGEITKPRATDTFIIFEKSE